MDTPSDQTSVSASSTPGANTFGAPTSDIAAHHHADRLYCDEAVCHEEMEDFTINGAITAAVPRIADLLDEFEAMGPSPDVRARPSLDAITAAVPRICDLLREEYDEGQLLEDDGHTLQGAITAAVPRIADLLREAATAASDDNDDEAGEKDDDDLEDNNEDLEDAFETSRREMLGGACASSTPGGIERALPHPSLAATPNSMDLTGMMSGRQHERDFTANSAFTANLSTGGLSVDLPPLVPQRSAEHSPAAHSAQQQQQQPDLAERAPLDVKEAPLDVKEAPLDVKEAAGAAANALELGDEYAVSESARKRAFGVKRKARQSWGLAPDG
eukprot:5034282-Pyramimonas_sp.AAC.1